MSTSINGSTLTFNDATTQTTAASAAAIVTTTNVLNATASGATAGGVGTYAYIKTLSGGSFAPGTNIATSLRYARDFYSDTGSGVPAGTWKVMGWLYTDAGYGQYFPTICLRIA